MNTAQPKPRRRWYQFRLRTLLVVVTLAGCGLGWLGIKVLEARQQQAAVAAIENLGGHVRYDYEFTTIGGRELVDEPPRPAWLRALLGDDFFRSVVEVDLSETRATAADFERLKSFDKLKGFWAYRTQLGNADLEHLRGLTQLETLDLRQTQVSDTGLECINPLTQLKSLSLAGTDVTDAGVAKLRTALPHCKITR